MSEESSLQELTAKRIVGLRKEAQLTAKEVAAKLNVLSANGSASRVSNWEQAFRGLKSLQLVKYCILFNTTADYLLGLTEHRSPARHDVDYVSANKSTITVNNQIVTLKNGPNACVYTREYIESRNLRDHKLVSISAPDNSMEGVIDKGDEVLIDTTQTDILSRDIFAIYISGNIWLRWIQGDLDGGYDVSSENKDKYPAQKITHEKLKSLQIIGRVVRISRDR